MPKANLERIEFLAGNISDTGDRAVFYITLLAGVVHHLTQRQLDEATDGAIALLYGEKQENKQK